MSTALLLLLVLVVVVIIIDQRLMSIFAQVIDSSDARMCELQNTGKMIAKELKSRRACYPRNGRRWRAEWLTIERDEEELMRMFGTVDLNESFTEKEWDAELKRARERNIMLQEV